MRTFLTWFASFFFFNATATTEIYTLSLHDALPISQCRRRGELTTRHFSPNRLPWDRSPTDRKSTRLNSSHTVISYAVFCLKKKNEPHRNLRRELREGSG